MSAIATVVGTVDPKLTWYVARAGGLVAWGASAAGILWGLALSSARLRSGRSARTLDLHRYLGTLTLVFTLIHLAGLWFDDFVTFGPAEILVPLASPWRPGPVAWGIVAFYLLVAVMVTSWARRRLPRRLWHTVHLGSYGLFVTATVHGYQSGTDRVNRLVLGVGAAVCLAVAFGTAVRIRSAVRRAGTEARQVDGLTRRAQPRGVARLQRGTTGPV